MDLDFVPPHLVVVGGSYVGLEFAQMFRRFGSRVTVVEMGPRVVAREDEDVSLEIQDFLRAEGIELRLARGVHQRAEGSRGTFRRPGLQGGRAPRARHASAARRRPGAQYRRSRPGRGRDQRPTSAATSRSTKRFAPPIRTSGRWATATARAPSPTPPTTTTRSSPTTCSRTPAASTPTGCPCTRSTPTRRSGASA